MVYHYPFNDAAHYGYPVDPHHRFLQDLRSDIRHDERGSWGSHPGLELIDISNWLTLYEFGLRLGYELFVSDIPYYRHNRVNQPATQDPLKLIYERENKNEIE